MVKTSALPNMGQIVLSAFKDLTKNTGWTTRTISKFIKMEYQINDPKISRKVSRALKRGVKLGLLQNNNGWYRLNNMSGLVKPHKVQKLRFRRRQIHERAPRISSSQNISSI